MVDDDVSMLKGLERLLKAHGFNAELFDSSEAVYERGAFDDALCMVLDINLKGRSGIELLHEINDQGVLIPVVFITGNDSELVRKAATDAGCIAYLTKPFTSEALIAPIELLIQSEARL